MNSNTLEKLIDIVVTKKMSKFFDTLTIHDNKSSISNDTYYNIYLAIIVAIIIYIVHNYIKNNYYNNNNKNNKYNYLCAIDNGSFNCKRIKLQ